MQKEAAEASVPDEVQPRPSTKLRARLKEDFKDAGFTAGCSGCDALKLKKGYHTKHSRVCRDRMETVLSQSPEGRERLDRANQKVNEGIAEKMETDLGPGQHDQPPVPEQPAEQQSDGGEQEEPRAESEKDSDARKISSNDE